MINSCHIHEPLWMMECMTVRYQLPLEDHFNVSGPFGQVYDLYIHCKLPKHVNFDLSDEALVTLVSYTVPCNAWCSWHCWPVENWSTIQYHLIWPLLQCLPTLVNTGTWLTLMTPNWWSCKFWYFWGFGNRITDLIQTCRLYRFCQHHCPLANITRPCIRIIYFIYITYLVKLYLVLSVPLQFPDGLPGMDENMVVLLMLVDDITILGYHSTNSQIVLRGKRWKDVGFSLNSLTLSPTFPTWGNSTIAMILPTLRCPSSPGKTEW